MIDFGFTASMNGTGQAGWSPAGQSALQRTDDMSVSHTGFFGMLLAMVGGPLEPDLPAAPSGNIVRPGSQEALPTPESFGAPCPLVLSGGPALSAVPAMFLEQEDTPAGEAPGDTGPVPSVDPGVGGTQSPEEQAPGNALSDESASGNPGAAANPAESGPRSAAAMGHGVKVLQDLLPWGATPQDAGGEASGGISVRGAAGMVDNSAQREHLPAGESSPANRPGGFLGNEAFRPGGGNVGTVPAGESSPANRPGGFFANEVLRPGGGNVGTVPAGESSHGNRSGVILANQFLRAGEGSDGPVQNQVLPASARTAGPGNLPEQTVSGTAPDRVTIAPHEEVFSAPAKPSGALITAARGESVPPAAVKPTHAGRVEPVATRVDVENTFTFGASQGTEPISGKSTPPGEVWARAVVSRITDEVADTRAAGKTAANLDITTESGEIVRVRIAIRSNMVSARIGVMESETKEILSNHIPQLSQRLQIENLVPERFDIYVIGGNGEGGQRGQQRRPRWTADPSEGQDAEDELIYVSSERRAFEKWA